MISVECMCWRVKYFKNNCTCYFLQIHQLYIITIRKKCSSVQLCAVKGTVCELIVIGGPQWILPRTTSSPLFNADAHTDDQRSYDKWGTKPPCVEYSEDVHFGCVLSSFSSSSRSCHGISSLLILNAVILKYSDARTRLRNFDEKNDSVITDSEDA